MLLVPLGPADRELRSFPLVSVTIACALVALFVVSGPHSLGDDWNAKVESRARRLESLLWDNPHLELSPRVEALLGGGARAEIVRRREEDRRRPPEARRFSLGGQEDVDGAQRALLAALEESPTWRWGFVPAAPSLVHALTSMFLHGNWMHLFGNLLFFLAVAPFLEDVFGRLLFSALYLSSGLVAAYVHGALEWGSSVPMIGASGAIAGLMGAFLVRLGTTRIRFLFLPVVFLPFIRLPFRLSAAIVLPAWFASQMFLADTPGLETGVALWAHIGGFLFGIVVAGAFRVARVEKRWVEPAPKGAPRAVTPAESPEELEAALRASLATSDPRGSGLVADRLLAAFVQGRDPARARDLVAQMRGRFDERLPARFLLSAARFLEEDGQIAEALPLYQEIADRFPSDPFALPALLGVAGILESRGRTRDMAEVLDRASRHPGYSVTWDAKFREVAGRSDFGRRSS